MKTITIGRLGNQPFKISEDCNGVSREHARITISDSGEWVLEDIKGPSGNGTFIRDLRNPEWSPVIKARITPETMIRLGQFHSFQFMAHRVEVDDPKDFTFEFMVMRQLWGELTEAIEREEKRLEKRKKQMTMVAVGGIAIGLLSAPLTSVIGYSLSGLSSVGLGARMLMSPNSKELTAARAARQKLVVCPNCGQQLSENEINNLRCMVCKAQ